jgi:hypothetical protein
MANKKIILLGCACTLVFGIIPLSAWHSNEHTASMVKSFTVVCVAFMFMLAEIRISGTRSYFVPFVEPEPVVLEGELLPPLEKEPEKELPKVERIMTHCEENDFYKPMTSILHEKRKTFTYTKKNTGR